MARYRATMKDLLEKVYKEDGHQDVSSSKRMCRTIVEDAQQIETKLNSMSPEDSLDTWWTNKLAVSANNLNKARDYIVNDVKEELELDEGKMKTIATMFDQGKSAEEIAKALKLPISTVKTILGEGINPYVSMQRDSKTGKMNYVVLDKDEKEAYKTTDQRLAQNFLNKNYSKLKEENLDEFTLSQLNTLKKSYADMKGKTISPEKANALSKALDKLDLLSLRQLNKEKIPFISTLARNKIYRKTGKFEEVEIEESAAAAEIQRTNTRRDSMDYGMYKKAVELLRTKQYAKLGKHIYDAETAPREYVMGVLDKKEPSTFKKIFGNQTGYYSLMKPKLKEELEEQTMRQKAVMIAKKMAGNMTDAVKEIEKLMKGLSKDPVVATTLKRVNENKEDDVPKGSHRMPDGTIMKDSEHKKDNEKKESENKDATIATLKDQIAMLKQKLENEKNKAVKPEPNPDTGEVPLTVGVAYKHFKDKAKKEDVQEANMVSDISGISIPALKREAAKFKIKVARVTPGGPMGAEYEVTFTGAEKDLIAYAKEHLGFDDKPGTYQQLKKHLNMDYVPEADLTKSQIKKVHDKADELPKDSFRDRYGKKQGDSVRYAVATNMVKKKLGIKEDRRLYVETIAGLKKKAEKSGMPYSILKKVYDRGMAAWKGGHRPGATQQQWAFARVNSFVTKSSGTWGGADKDLAAKVRGSK